MRLIVVIPKPEHLLLMVVKDGSGLYQLNVVIAEENVPASAVPLLARCQSSRCGGGWTVLHVHDGVVGKTIVEESPRSSFRSQ